MPEPLEATLQRLKAERDEADRRYNDALTALDAALGSPPELPAPPPPYDEHQITPLNEAWNIVPAPPAAAGLAGRLKGVIWRTVGPFLQRQLAFNSRLVDHLNRNAVAHRDAHRTLETLLARVREELARQTEFRSRLMVLLQQITPYVDTKDRDSAGGALVLNAALSALADSDGKRWESLAARTYRHEAHTETVAANLARLEADLRAGLAIAQQAAAAARRELERLHGSGIAAAPAPAAAHGVAADTVFAGRIDAYKYVGFEDQFRGAQDVIRARFESYLPFFDGASDVLDVGCGRGEFLDLLAARGIRAHGIDPNPEMVEVCRARGLDARQADAAAYLAGVEEGGLGGIFAAQVVEHLEPSYLLRVLDLAFHTLRPGGRLVLETLNPACWVAFFESYIRDITHVRPLHPDTLKYLVTASGFSAASVEFRSPVPAADRLQRLASDDEPDQRLAEIVDAFNANADKLNARMFTNLDYAVVAVK